MEAANSAAAAAFLATAKVTHELQPFAAPAQWPIVGKPNLNTDVWTCGSRFPSPEIRRRSMTIVTKVIIDIASVMNIRKRILE